MKEPLHYITKLYRDKYIVKKSSRSKSISIKIPINRKRETKNNKKRLEGDEDRDDWVELVYMQNKYLNISINMSFCTIKIPFYKVDAWIPIKNAKWVTEGELNGGFDKMGMMLGDDKFDHEFPIRDVKNYTSMFVFTNKSDVITHILTINESDVNIPTMNIEYITNSNTTFNMKEIEAEEISYYMMAELSKCTNIKVDKKHIF